ncbi:MAG: hypothetical protein H6710_05160 [Myxococcales bacterium]|nr:hypothetical protein [Myxococcales bacterium]MCB9705559.1 hypothetical protein [Myxococcales bacterium]
MLHHTFIGLLTASSLLLGDVAHAQSPGYPEPESPPPATYEEPGAPASETVTVTTTTEPAPAEPAATTVVVAPQPAPAPAPAPVYGPRKKRGVGLMIAGWTLFGVSYAITAFSGAIIVDNCSTSDTYDCRRLGGSLMIPVLGPFMALPEVQTMSGRMAMIFFSGLPQVGGLSMGIAGAVLFSRSRRGYQMVNADGVRLARGRDVRLGSSASPLGGGFRLTYRF